MDEEMKKEIGLIKLGLSSVLMNQVTIMHALSNDLSEETKHEMRSGACLSTVIVDKIYPYRDKTKQREEEKRERERKQNASRDLFSELMEVLNRKE